MLVRLASTKLAAVLISVFLALGVIAFIVPQQSHAALTLYSEWQAANPTLAATLGILGLDDVFASPLFLITMLLLAVNLTSCTLLRVRRRMGRQVHIPSKVPDDAIAIEVAGDSESVAKGLRFGLPLWGVNRSQRDGLLYLRLDQGHVGFIGSVILHVGLLLLLVGGAASGLMRFDGRMVLTEGETLLDQRESYLGVPKEPRLGAVYRPFTVRLDSLRFEYEDGFVTQAFAQLTFADASGSAVKGAVVNGPARWQGKSFLLVKGGHAVRMDITDADGTVLVPDSAIRLGEPVDGGYSDELELPDGRRLELVTVADARAPETALSEPLALRDPQVAVSLKGSTAKVDVRPGQRAALGDLRVGVSDVRLWNEFAVRADGGIPVTYTAFVVILLGTMIRLMFGKARVACFIRDSVDGVVVHVWASDPAVTQRVAKIVTGLRPLEDE